MSYHHEDCECEKYRPNTKLWEIKLDGTVYKCRMCGRFVDSRKWKGGLIKRAKGSTYVSSSHCPCCGIKMAIKRRSKKKLVDSITHQLNFPKEHNQEAQKTLRKKIKILQKMQIIQV